MRGRRAVSYLLVPIALLAVAVTGSCTADLDEGMEGEGGSEGESVEEVGGNPDLLVAPTAPQNAEPPDDTAESCPVGQTLVPGDDNRNIIKNRVDDACIVTLGGGDLVINKSRTAATILAGEGDDRVVTGHGDTLVAAGSGWDTVYAKGGDDEIYGQRDGDILIGDGGNDLLDGGPGWDTLVGGRGHDTIQGGSGSDLIIAGAGDDVVVAGSGDDLIIGDGLFFASGGNDEIVPGPGRDKVSAGSGDDTVIVYDVCELEWGEVLNGGSGTDTLITPLSIEKLENLGVTIVAFENVILDPNPEASACGSCDCSLDGPGIECCSGRGVCNQEVDDAVVCRCDPGFAAQSCGFDVDAQFLSDPPPAGCSADDPSCWRQYSAGTIEFNVDPSITCPDLARAVEESDDDGLIRGIVWRPENSFGDWAAGTFPALLWVPGNGYDNTEYEYLQGHLAQNGIISVSINNLGGQETSTPVANRAELFRCYRRALAASPVGAHWNDILSFGGHSRGGEAAVVGAMGDFENGNDPLSTVVGLAPSSQCETVDFSDDAIAGSCGLLSSAGEEGWERLADSAADGILLIQASEDGDVDGETVNLFDNASDELDHRTVDSDDLVKSKFWLFEGPHLNWSDRVAGGLGKAVVSYRIKTFSTAFVTAFLRWLSAGEIENRRFFSTGSTPACVLNPQDPRCNFPAYPTKPFFRQFREGGLDLGGKRVVVHHFGGQDITANHPLGPVSWSGAEAPLTPNVRTSNQPFTTEFGTRTRAMRLAAAAGEAESATFFFPGLDVDSLLGPDLRHLSLRIYKEMVGDMANAGTLSGCQALADLNAGKLILRVILDDTSANAGEVTVNMSPTDVIWTEKGTFQFCAADGFWTTVRIPLSRFSVQGVNLHSMNSVTISLDSADHGGEEIGALIDSLEFTGHDFDPDCGDGTVQFGEACDGSDFDGLTCSSFGFDLGDLSCSNCFISTAGCSGGDPEPIPEDEDPELDNCTDSEGNPGCACAPVVDSQDAIEACALGDALACDSVTPDGPFYDDKYCHGEQVVCGQTAGLNSICRECGVDPKAADGCLCSEVDCGAAGLGCWGEADPTPETWGGNAHAGRCWDLDVPPPHVCIENCSTLGRVCVFEEPGSPHVAGSLFPGHSAFCASVGCGNPPSFCEGASGGYCREWVDQVECLPGVMSDAQILSSGECCQTECENTADCVALGYPSWYSCGATNRCIPPTACDAKPELCP